MDHIMDLKNTMLGMIEIMSTLDGLDIRAIRTDHAGRRHLAEPLEYQ